MKRKFEVEVRFGPPAKRQVGGVSRSHPTVALPSGPPAPPARSKRAPIPTSGFIETISEPYLWQWSEDKDELTLHNIALQSTHQIAIHGARGPLVAQFPFIALEISSFESREVDKDAENEQRALRIAVYHIDRNELTHYTLSSSSALIHLSVFDSVLFAITETDVIQLKLYGATSWFAHLRRSHPIRNRSVSSNYLTTWDSFTVAGACSSISERCTFTRLCRGEIHCRSRLPLGSVCMPRSNGPLMVAIGTVLFEKHCDELIDDLLLSRHNVGVVCGGWLMMFSLHGDDGAPFPFRTKWV